MRKFFRATIWLLMMCAFTKVAMGQNTTGNITGTVTDSSGAVVSGATVVAHNIATGVDTPAVTNQSGAYAIRFLSIGQYEVSVTAAGFGGQKFPAFTLEQNQVAKFDAKLAVGDVSVVANVNADVAPILNTNDASLGLTLSANEIQNIPLNGRNFSSVTLFQPGAVNTDPTGMTGSNAIERNTTSNGIASINGNRNQANNYTLDGADQNEPQNNLIAYNPAPDAIAEVHVVTANAPAQYGNANGGAIASILKSGTNQFHGSAYGYLQNQTLNANSWLNKDQPTPVARNPYTQSIFGGTIGGPILRDKLFFFADYEGARSHTGGVKFASVLTAAMRQGDFSALLAQKTPTQLFDSQNKFAQFQNNKVSVINPVATYLFAHPELYPLPNVAPLDGLLQNNFQGSQRSFVRNDQGDIKIDWSATATNKFSAFYAQSDAGDTQTAVIPIFFPSQNVYPTKLGGGSWIHTFSSAVVNEARFGFTRVRWDNGIPTDPSGAFGLNGNAIVGIPFGAQSFPGFSGQSISNNASFLGTSANVQVIRDNTFNYYDNLTWQHGRQLFSIGVQATRYQQNYLNVANYGTLGQFSYSGNFTGDPSVAGAGGYGPADFVLDRVTSTQLGSTAGTLGNRQWRVAGYVQDDWKATNKLTVNIGLRYEYDQPWTEVNNKTANVLLATGTPIYAGSIPAGAPAGAQVCPTRACYDANYNQFMPRIGFAYQAAPRFVIRSGYGATSFFEGNAGNQRLTTSPPFVKFNNQNAVTPTNNNGGTPFTIEQGFGATTGSFGAWPQNIKPAYISEYSLTTEYALTNKTSLSVGYLGESGQHLITYRNANQLVSPTATSGPYDALVGAGNGLLLTESNGTMNYNAGQVSLRQRASRGLEGTVNYTYARAMTNSSGNYGTPGITGSNGAFQDGYNGHADYGPAGQDIRHNLNGLLVYSVPFGRGQTYGSGINRYEDLLVGGWKIGASGVIYSGLPITMGSPNQISQVNSFGAARPNQYRHLNIVNRSITNWWGTDPSATPCASGVDNGVCAYGIAAPNTFGTAAINTERAPGYHQLDMSASKDFRITDRHSFGFSTNFYNILNTTSLGNPDSGINDGNNFGLIQSSRSQERRIELSGHYHF